MLAAHDRGILDYIAQGHDLDENYRDRDTRKAVGSVSGTAEDLRAKADELDREDPASRVEIEAPRFLSDPMNTADHANGITAALDHELIGEGLNPLARALLIELALFMDEDGKGFRDYKTAATRWGVTEDAIGKALRRCAKAGLIEVSRDAYRRHSTEWRLTKRLRSILRKVATEADLPSEKGRSQRRPSEEKVGPASEKVGPTSEKVGASADPVVSEREKEAAAADSSQSPNPGPSASALAAREPDPVDAPIEADEILEPENTEPRRTPEGIEYTEKVYRQWVDQKVRRKRGGEGLRVTIYRQDRAEFEDELDNGRLGRKLRILNGETTGAEFECDHTYNGRWRTDRGQCTRCGSHIETDHSEPAEPEGAETINADEGDVSAVVADLAETWGEL